MRAEYFLFNYWAKILNILQQLAENIREIKKCGTTSKGKVCLKVSKCTQVLRS